MKILLKCIIITHIYTTVSYTHLDVYKRQTIKRIDNETADTILIALALLPEGTDIGTELLWENLEYKIINGI